MRQDAVYSICKEQRKNVIPSADQIVRETFDELKLIESTPLVPGTPPEKSLKHFNEYLYNVFTQSLVVLERYEREAYVSALREIAHHDSARISGKNLDATFDILFDEIWWVMQSRSQSRKSRGGSDFQYEVEGMLRLCKIPFTSQAKKERTDLILPSSSFFDTNRSKSIVMSLKRTLRERWSEVVNELYALRAPNVYLAVAEEQGEISDEKVKKITDYNIHLLVWDNVKEIDFPDDPNVMGYSQFANDEIQSFRRYWTPAPRRVVPGVARNP